jgi:phytoene synthase
MPGDLRAAYGRCRQLTRRHGTTYFWATQLLPRRSRPAVYALYGFCRYADDIVDDLGERSAPERAAALAALGDRLRAALAGGAVDPVGDPVVAAVAHTAAGYGIDGGCFDRFLRSMTMDLTVARYQSWDDLCGYMDGSAAVIGEMMLPILEPRTPAAAGPARQLGLAFQLTNFLRDVGEDLDRGRVYLPAEDLARFGADPAARRVTPAWRALMAFQIARNRTLYRAAATGLPLLPPWSARAIGTAHTLYARILDEIEANRYDVFTTRARVRTSRKLAAAARAAVRPRYGEPNDVHAAVACTPGAVAPPQAHTRPWNSA